MNLLTKLRSRSLAVPSDFPQISSDGGYGFPGPLSLFYGSKTVEAPGNDFASYVNGLYKANGVVFACARARERVLSQTRFKYRALSDKRMFGNANLSLLETPWPNGTTGDLLQRMEQDATNAGNAYLVHDNGRLYRLNPGRSGLILGSDLDPQDPEFQYDARVIGLVYRSRPGRALQLFTPDEFLHWCPIPDPDASFRGMSWLTPVIREITADTSVTNHKQKFFENGATPNLVVKFPEAIDTTEKFKPLRAAMEESHAGLDNAYRTLYLAAGADATVIGATMIDFAGIQGHLETRVCAAAGVPPSVVGVIEGLKGSALNAGNFDAARREFTDMYYEPTIQDVCATLAPLANVPTDAELWYDTSDIGFLREDQKDAADIRNQDAITIRQLTDAGFVPDTAVRAVISGDFTLLKHSGLFSVQLQPPSEAEPDASDPNEPAEPPEPKANGQKPPMPMPTPMPAKNGN